MKLLQELIQLSEAADVYVFSYGEDDGEDDGETTTKGDAAKVIKKMLSVFRNNVLEQGDIEHTIDYEEQLPKWKKMTDPAELYKSLIKSDLAWDGYALRLEKNGKEINGGGRHG